ncbi:MAG: CotH kinase family protein [Bacteroidia bacterium]|nr:CotH kinase family protein [Bacteroidia bacterium]
MKSLKFTLFFLVLIIANNLKSQAFYDVTKIQKIEIQFSQSNWDYMLDTSKAGKDNYVLSQWVKINGVQFDSAGVKYKGNSSYNVNNAKNPFHIELDFVKNQDYQGYKDIKLSNGFKDPSFVREVLSYNILNKYMPSPLSNYCQVYVNGVYIGVYANTEAVSKTFVDSRFYSKNNSFFFMDNFNCPLKYNGPDSASYTTYTIKSTTGWKALINLCDTLVNKPSFIESILDVDRSLWMMGFDNVLVNLDSYIGAPTHNYYAYRDDNGRFNPIVWDVNEAFGNFTNAGGGPPLTLAQEQVMSPYLHLTDPNWPLIQNLLANPMFKRMYIAHMRTIVNENFANGSYTTTAYNLQSVIDTALQSDLNKFYTYSQFTVNVNTNVTSGPSTIAGLSVLMGPRVNYLQSSTDFTLTPPTITSATAATTPSLNAAVTITANVTNANSNGVYLGYRFAVTQRFNRVLMYDDGLNNDGAAGDNVFGATFTMTASSAQYYVYAENNNAGMFAPERAEYEFYTLAAIQTASVGQVYINEFLADNAGDVSNETFQFEDWIELYNTTSSQLELSGLYLTDNYSAPTKFPFPQNTLIPANGYLIIWADENPSTASYLHCNFKLSAGGERLMLSNGSGTVLDSITFGPQTTDKSMARCPDGVGSFSTSAFPSFKLSNCAIGVNELNNNGNQIRVYPNPAKNYFVVRSNTNKEESITVYNTIGEQIYKGSFTNETVINTSTWVSGIYFVRTDYAVKKIIVNH